MPVRTYAIRLKAEGQAEIRQALDETGQAGKRAFDGVTSSAERAGEATDKLKRRTEEAAEAARRMPTGPAPGPQPATPAAPGATRPAPAPSPGPDPSDTVRKNVERLRLRLDDDYRNQRQRDKDAATIAASGLSDTEASRLRFLSERKYAVNDNKAEGLNTYDRLFVKYQATDFTQQIIAGQSPITALVQQSGQVYQQLADREGGLSKGLQQLAVSARGLVTPFSVAAVAVTAAAGVFAYGAYQVAKDQATLERATLGLGRATGVSAGQLDDLARANAEAGKVSTSTAREIAAGYASGGQIALPVIENLIKRTSDYARVTGQDVPTATAELARMFADPARGADDLASKLGGLSDATRQLIQTQIEQGDRTAAQTTLADALKAAIDANTLSTSRWAQAWNIATAAADGYWEAAKRAVQVRFQQWGLGDGPSATQTELDKVNEQIRSANQILAFSGREPLGLGSSLIQRRDALQLILDTAKKEAEIKAQDERSDRASRTAGDIARAVDPNFARLSELRKQASDLRDALADPMARAKLADFGQTETAYLGVTRAISTLTDTNGKLISSEELLRRQDQLRLDALSAKTPAEKAAVAERQKAFDLIGKVVTEGDARGQVARAGLLARAQEDGKGGKSDKDDAYDRALRSTDDRIRRQGEEAETYGMTADVVARYRVEQELLTAAKRADREITPDLTAQIRDYAERAGDAAKRVEDLRDSSRLKDRIDSLETDGVKGLVRDLRQGKSAADALSSSLDRVVDRLLDMTIDAALKPGKGGGVLGSLLGSILGSGGSGGIDVGLNFLSLDRGGYTGPGGVLDPAGIVHRGEIVWSQDDIRRAGGVYSVETLRRGGRGYADGGYVGPSRDRFTMPTPAAMRPANDAAPIFQTTVINNTPARVETREVPDGRGGRRQEVVINEMMAAGIRSPQGQQALSQPRVASR